MAQPEPVTVTCERCKGILANWASTIATALDLPRSAIPVIMSLPQTHPVTSETQWRTKGRGGTELNHYYFQCPMCGGHWVEHRKPGAAVKEIGA